jgi:hypothetical protein
MGTQYVPNIRNFLSLIGDLIIKIINYTVPKAMHDFIVNNEMLKPFIVNNETLNSFRSIGLMIFNISL